MDIQVEYEYFIALLTLVVVLALCARTFRLPPAISLICGGALVAFLPFVPAVTIDPNLVMAVFLPPILLSSAYQTVWPNFRKYLATISSLAIGAVAFTTFAVAFVVHWLRPDLPWSSAFALGAVVSPPDAVAAKAVLDRLRLPEKVTTVLTGESLVNDASGFILFHFAVSSALSGKFSAPAAVGDFFVVNAGGVAVGFCMGWIALRLLRIFGDTELIVTGTLLLAAFSYLVSDQMGFSGVLSTVTTGLMLGWTQHDIFTAKTRIRTQAFWQVLVFLLQSTLFVLVGLSLREALEHWEKLGDGLHVLALPVMCVVLTVVSARFIWLLGTDALLSFLSRIGFNQHYKRSIPATIIVSWAGMRGVVTLAAALSLPLSFEGRDLILASAFGIIFVTVLVQGTTLPLLVKLFPSKTFETPEILAKKLMNVRKKIAQTQKAEVSRQLGYDDDELFLNFLQQRWEAGPDHVEEDKKAMTHVELNALLSGIHSARTELLRLYKQGSVTDKLMKNIEADLDLQEVTLENHFSENYDSN